MAGAIALGGLHATDPRAQDFPTKPVRMLVGYPAGGGTDVTARLNAAIRKTIDLPQTTEALKAQGLEPRTSTPERLAALIRTEIAQSTRLVKLADLKPE